MCAGFIAAAFHGTLERDDLSLSLPPNASQLAAARCKIKGGISEAMCAPISRPVVVCPDTYLVRTIRGSREKEVSRVCAVNSSRTGQKKHLGEEEKRGRKYTHTQKKKNRSSSFSRLLFFFFNIRPRLKKTRESICFDDSDPERVVWYTPSSYNAILPVRLRFVYTGGGGGWVGWDGRRRILNGNGAAPPASSHSFYKGNAVAFLPSTTPND